MGHCCFRHLSFKKYVSLTLTPVLSNNEQYFVAPVLPLVVTTHSSLDGANEVVGR